MMEKVALFSHRVIEAGELPTVLDRAFALFSTSRPGPVHIEIPIDVMGLPAAARRVEADRRCPPAPAARAIAEAAA